MQETKDNSEYGWQVISRSSYEKLLAQEYAGPGTPLHPERPGYWVMSYEADRGTVLYTGVTIEEGW